MRTTFLPCVIFIAATFSSSIPLTAFTPKPEITLSTDTTLLQVGHYTTLVAQLSDRDPHVPVQFMIDDQPFGDPVLTDATGEADKTYAPSAAGTVTIKAVNSGYDGSNTKTITVVDIHITTTDPNGLQLKQEEPGKLEVQAQISPSTRTIKWKASGDGSDVVDLLSTQTGGTSVVTVSIIRPVTNSWTSDTTFTLIAYDSEDDDIKDSTTVKLVKFSRGDGETSPGSQPIYTSFGYAGTNSEGGEYEWNDFDANTMGASGISAPAAHAHTNQQDAVIDDPHTNVSTLTLDYVNNRDECRGYYSLRENVTYSGHLRIDGVYQGIWDNSSVILAAAVAASIDSQPATIDSSSLAMGYASSASITMGIDVNGNAGGGTVGLSIGVNIPASRPDELSDGANPTGTQVIEVSKTAHAAGMEIQINKLIRVASDAKVQQLADNDWDLDAAVDWMLAKLGQNGDGVMHLKFEPEF